METAILKKSMETAMMKETLDMHKSLVMQVINSVPPTSQNSTMPAEARAAQGVGQRLDTVA